jgi:hypothetical protein
MQPDFQNRVTGSESLAEHLRLAKPCLILRAEEMGEGWFRLEPYIGQADGGDEEVLSEGYDPHYSPLGPVYWRIIKRGDATFYWSTFLASRERIIKGWGVKGLAYCDPMTGMAVARIETYLPPEDHLKRT